MEYIPKASCSVSQVIYTSSTISAIINVMIFTEHFLCFIDFELFCLFFKFANFTFGILV